MIGLYAEHLGKNVIKVWPGVCVDDTGEELLLHMRSKLVAIPKKKNKTFRVYLRSDGQFTTQEGPYTNKLYRSAQVGEFTTNEEGEV